jgi:hypothetical protein
MKLNLSVALSILLAILFIGTVGTFLVYVPALSVFTAAIVLLGLGLMFGIGLMTGTQWRKLPLLTHHVRRHTGPFPVVR